MVEEALKPTVIKVDGKLVTSKDPMVLEQGDFTELTNMRYKVRNPISILGMTKYNTATVVDGTASPGTYMKTRQGFHFRKDTPTDLGGTPGGGDDEPPWEPPNQAALWAYFKFDEATGTDIEDYSPIDENGTVNTTFGDPTTKFWSVTGFGYNSTAAPLTWVYRYATVSRNTTYCSIIGFLKVGSVPHQDYSKTGYFQLGQGGTATNWLRIASGLNTPYYWTLSSGSIDDAPQDTAFGSSSPTIDTWYCVFATSDSSAVGQPVKLYVRASGGAFVETISEVADSSQTNTQTAVFAFGHNNTPAHMTAGDVLYYAHATSIGVISVDDANDIYDNLKDRYGMT